MDELDVLQKMNLTQKVIIVSWVILTAIAVCVLSKITIFLPYGLNLFFSFVVELSMRRPQLNSIFMITTELPYHLWYFLLLPGCGICIVY